MSGADPDRDRDLARFQVLVLSTLHAGGPSDDLQQAVLDQAADPELAAWVRSWEPDLVDLASLLVRTWAVRDDGPPTT